MASNNYAEVIADSTEAQRVSAEFERMAVRGCSFKALPFNPDADRRSADASPAPKTGSKKLERVNRHARARFARGLSWTTLRLTGDGAALDLELSWSELMKLKIAMMHTQPPGAQMHALAVT